MKKLFKSLTFKRIVNGVVDSIPVVSTVKANMRSSEEGVGNIDWTRLIISIISGVVTIYLSIQVAKGTLTIDEMVDILKAI